MAIWAIFCLNFCIAVISWTVTEVDRAKVVQFALHGCVQGSTIVSGCSSDWKKPIVIFLVLVFMNTHFYVSFYRLLRFGPHSDYFIGSKDFIIPEVGMFSLYHYMFFSWDFILKPKMTRMNTSNLELNKQVFSWRRY
jgi:hypothetical protein